MSSPSAGTSRDFSKRPKGKRVAMRKPTCASRPRCAGRPPVRRDLRRLRADLQEEAALVGGLSGAQILDLDRVRGDALLVVEDLDLDEVRAPDLRAERQAPHDREVAQRQLAHDAAHDDEREEHPEEQIEQVVAGVDRGEADAERDADEELPLARELEPARRAQAAAPRARTSCASGATRRTGCAAGMRSAPRQSGTGMRAMISRTAASASSRVGTKPSACVARRTRCARTGTARSWMSSAMQ